jgi:transcriptional regulator with XRE-family HTH domain
MRLESQEPPDVTDSAKPYACGTDPPATVPGVVGKSLTSQQNERVRAAVRQLLELHGGSQTRVAPLIGVEQATLSRFMSGVQGTSSHVAMRVASILGLNPLDLLDPTSKSGVIPRVSTVDPAYPSRAKAEVAARVMDCSEDDIRGAIAAHVGPDPGDIYWINEFLRARDRRRWAEDAKHPPHSGDRPTGGDDNPHPKTRRTGSPRG